MTSPLADLYANMLTIRLLEHRLQAYCDRGEAGDLHFNRGQEAVAVSVCSALRPTDHIVTHHRTIAHQVARGADLYPLVAELLGKRTGVNGGRAGEMHISDPKIRHAFSFQLVGTCIPVAVGLAWALKYHHKRDEVVAVFFGDAATSNGQFHEGLNIAVVHQLPILFVCEDNGRAGNIGPAYYMGSADGVSGRAFSYGIPVVRADGRDVTNVADSAQVALSELRVRGTPVMLNCSVERLCWHKQGQRDIRTPEQLAMAAQRDPLLRWPDSLDKEALTTRINARLDEVFARVDADLLPEVSRD